MNDSSELTLQDWVFRIYSPAAPSAKAVLLAIHGRTGNESSMEIFIQKLNSVFWVILPRAPFAAQGGGFSWVTEEKGIHQDFSAFDKSALGLIDRVDQIRIDREIANLPLYLLGFSQGAALSLAISLNYTKPDSKIGLLAGFLPLGRQPQSGSLTQQKYFVAHGRQDQTVPVEQGRKVVQFLEACGAQVDYCEADTGHKLSMACFKQMEKFFLDH
jgi:phospholipase/carboxylesterase